MSLDENDDNVEDDYVEYDESGNCKAPYDVFDAVAFVIQATASGPLKIKGKIDRDYQTINLVDKNSLLTSIYPSWGVGFWKVVGAHTSATCKKKVSNKCEDVGEILDFLRLRIPKLNIAITTYKPSVIYPKDEQQMLCL